MSNVIHLEHPAALTDSELIYELEKYTALAKTGEYHSKDYRTYRCTTPERRENAAKRLEQLNFERNIRIRERIGGFY
jgi:hypothetical protein